MCRNIVVTQIGFSSNVEESFTAVVGDKHPAGWRSIGDTPTKMTSFSMRIMAVNIST